MEIKKTKGTFKDMTDEQMNSIQTAVVRQAVEDLGKAIRDLYSRPTKRDCENLQARIYKMKDAIARIDECTMFFKGEWYKDLCSCDGEKIRNKIVDDILKETLEREKGIELAFEMYKKEMKKRKKSA